MSTEQGLLNYFSINYPNSFGPHLYLYKYNSLLYFWLKQGEKRCRKMFKMCNASEQTSTSAK